MTDQPAERLEGREPGSVPRDDQERDGAAHIEAAPAAILDGISDGIVSLDNEWRLDLRQRRGGADVESRSRADDRPLDR